MAFLSPLKAAAGALRLLAFLALLAGFGAVPALARTPRHANFEGQSAPITCMCTAQAVAGQGTEWGTGVYSPDSAVCCAARHAGVIPPTGGLITVRPARGMPAYQGRTANGIQTSNYGPWSGGFTFRR